MTGHLHIVAGYKNHRTYLKQSYCKQPFKVADITVDKTTGLLSLMIMSSSPGVLDNDNFIIEVHVEENAKVQLTTQGYQRFFAMSSCASQGMNVHVGNKGSFCFLPHPGVPHAGSNFLSVNNIYLQAEHNLIWSEILTCGRKLSGEEFKFTRFHNVTNIYLHRKLVVKENVLVEPSKQDVQAIGQLEGYTHQSTLLFINDHLNLKKMPEACVEFLSGIEDIIFGISSLPVNGLIIRILGQKGELLFNCNNKLASLIQHAFSLNTYTEAEVISSELPGTSIFL